MPNYYFSLPDILSYLYFVALSQIRDPMQFVSTLLGAPNDNLDTRYGPSSTAIVYFGGCTFYGHCAQNITKRTLLGHYIFNKYPRII